MTDSLWRKLNNEQSEAVAGGCDGGERRRGESIYRISNVPALIVAARRPIMRIEMVWPIVGGQKLQEEFAAELATLRGRVD